MQSLVWKGFMNKKTRWEPTWMKQPGKLYSLWYCCNDNHYVVKMKLMGFVPCQVPCRTHYRKMVYNYKNTCRASVVNYKKNTMPLITKHGIYKKTIRLLTKHGIYNFILQPWKNKHNTVLIFLRLSWKNMSVHAYRRMSTIFPLPRCEDWSILSAIRVGPVFNPISIRKIKLRMEPFKCLNAWLWTRDVWSNCNPGLSTYKLFSSSLLFSFWQSELKFDW